MTPSSSCSIPENASGQEQYVTFRLNAEEYAVSALVVQEIIELASITPVPHLPPFLRGVINLRGTIVPVIDLKRKFGMLGSDYPKHTCVIIVEFSRGVMGLIVDAVSDVMQISPAEFAQPPSFGVPIRIDFIQGMARLDAGMLILLDTDRILSCEEVPALAESVAEGAQSDFPGPIFSHKSTGGQS